MLAAVLRGCGDAERPVIMIGLGVCLLRVIWLGTLFLRIHTLFVLCLCYPVSWAVTSVAMLLYYRSGAWKHQRSVIVDR